MDLARIVVTASGAALIVAVLLFFFGPRGRSGPSPGAPGR